MIAKSYLQKTLDKLEKLYNGSISTAEGLFYSKLALLELCGWIEESMDEIVQTCCHRMIKDKKERKEITEFISKNHSFEYDPHFRRMLGQIIGRKGLITFEKKVDLAKLQRLQATLSILKKARDNEAHTHIKGTTKRLDAPSVTKANYLLIYNGLIEIDEKLKKIGF